MYSPISTRVIYYYDIKQIEQIPWQTLHIIWGFYQICTIRCLSWAFWPDCSPPCSFGPYTISTGLQQNNPTDWNLSLFVPLYPDVFIIWQDFMITFIALESPTSPIIQYINVKKRIQLHLFYEICTVVHWKHEMLYLLYNKRAMSRGSLWSICCICISPWFIISLVNAIYTAWKQKAKQLPRMLVYILQTGEFKNTGNVSSWKKHIVKGLRGHSERLKRVICILNTVTSGGWLMDECNHK